MKITLTGVDERVSRDDLRCFPQSPCVEVGFLYTFDPDGRNRYPSRTWLTANIAFLAELGTGCALHVCGRRAREQLLAGELEDLALHASRIQINGHLESDEVARACALFSTKVIITQHTERNARLASDVPCQNHALLVDDSGGRGMSPKTWARPRTNKAVGFAGGLSSDNMANQLPKILGVACPRAWIDMEGKLRTEDWFDMRHARAAIEAFELATRM